jgi:hypothetical protein
MVLDEPQYLAVRDDMQREGIIVNKGRHNHHLWALADGSTATPPGRQKASTVPATTKPMQNRNAGADSGATAIAPIGDNERRALELIGRQAMELERLRQQLAGVSAPSAEGK